MQSMSAEFTVVDSTVQAAGQEDISLEITNWQIKWTPTTCLISKFNDDWAQSSLKFVNVGKKTRWQYKFARFLSATSLLWPTFLRKAGEF